MFATFYIFAISKMIFHAKNFLKKYFNYTLLKPDKKCLQTHEPHIVDTI